MRVYSGFKGPLEVSRKVYSGFTRSKAGYERFKRLSEGTGGSIEFYIVLIAIECF